MELEEVVKNLNESDRSDECVEYIKQISAFFEALTDFSKVGEHLAIVFQKPGIIGFLRKRNGNKQFEKSRADALSFLSSLLDPSQPAFGASIIADEYFKPIKEVADILWKTLGETSRNRTIALECLIALFNLPGLNANDPELNAGQLYRNLLEYTEKSSFPATVRGKILILLGVLAHRTGNRFLNSEAKYLQLFKHLISIIQKQVESTNTQLDVNIVHGAIKGLEYFLMSFAERINPGIQDWAILYEKLGQIIDPTISIEDPGEDKDGKKRYKLKRREFQRAGLELIVQHGDLFKGNFLHKHQIWFNDLLAWSKSLNRDDSRVGNRALIKFLNAISLLSSELDENDQETKELVLTATRYFHRKFTEMLNKKKDPENTNRGEQNIAVRGIGLISNFCADPELREEIFNKMIGQIESIIIELNVETTDKYTGSFVLIPTYVESVGNLLFQMEISDDETLASFQKRLDVIEQLIVALITFYPDMGGRAKGNAHYSVLKVAKSLYAKNFKYFVPTFERIFHESLTNIIASPTKLEAEIINASIAAQSTENEKKGKRSTIKTVSSYVPLFKNMMNYSFNDETGPYLYDILINWILVTFSRLDLTIEQIEDDLSDVDPMMSIKAKKIRDFQLFINIVDFFQELVDGTPNSLFEKWISTYLKEMLTFIQRNPLVSGFYKIFSKVLDISRKKDYFKEEDAERFALLQSGGEFFKSLSLKIHEYRDDLLLSVLDIWLSAPDVFILSNIESLDVTLQAVFRNGKSSFPLAARGIEALERWFLIREFPQYEMETMFRNIFPLLKSYFTSVGETNPTEGQPKIPEKIKSKARKRFGYRRMRAIQTELKDLNLKDLQMNILRVIGLYGNLLNLDDENSNVCFSFDEKFLKFAVPFQDIKPDIHLDYFLPRVFEICQNSSDRQLRSAACEFLHSVIIYFIGRATSNNPGPEEVFRKIFNVTMKLACDTDVVVQQLFNPLAIQIVHWFAKHASGNGFRFGDICLRIIIEGLVQSEEIALRDFGGICLSEFFDWSIRQSNKVQTENVIKNISAMSTHAAFQYRQGSVLAFNKIYRDFRENDQLLDTYTFQLFQAFIISLEISSEDDNSLLIKSTKQALVHFERIMIKKSITFNTEINTRLSHKSCKVKCLKDLVLWVFKKTASPNKVCRKECLRLVQSLLASRKVISKNRDVVNLENLIFEFERERGCRGRGELIRIAEKQLLNEGFFNKFESFNAAGDFYALLHTGNYPVSNLLKNPDSGFIEHLQSIIDSYELDSETLNTLSKLTFLVQSGTLSSELCTRILETTLRASKDQKLNPTKLFNLWNVIWGEYADDLNGELRKKIEQKFELNLEALEGEVENEVDWFLAFSKDEEKFIVKVLSNQRIAEFCERIWTFLENKIFQGSDALSISHKLCKILQSLLLLGLNLGHLGVQVVQMVFSPIKVRDSRSRQKIPKGELFQKYFIPVLVHCEQILNFKGLLEEYRINVVGGFIQNLLGWVKNDHKQRALFGPRIVEEICKVWAQISLNCDARTVSVIISGLAALDMGQCRDSSVLVKWWAKQLQSPDNRISDKAEFIHFLPLFGASKESESIQIVIETAETFVKRDMTSSELNWTTDEAYITKIFMKMLSYYTDETINPKIQQNFEYFETLVHFLSRIGSLTEETPCFKTFAKRLVRVLESSKAKSLIKDFSNQILDRIYKVSKENLDDRLAVAKYALIPALSKIGSFEFRTFYEQNILDILRTIKLNPTTLDGWTRKTIGFQLLEILSMRGGDRVLKKSKLNSIFIENWEEFKKGVPKPEEAKGNEFLQDLVSTCKFFTTQKSPCQNDDKVREANFKCNAASYNAFAAAIKVTQTEEKFLNLLLKENHDPTKRAVIWGNIIDCSKGIEFPILFKSRQEDQEEKEGGGGVTSTTSSLEQDLPNFLKPSKNLNTNRAVLSESSLANSAGIFDFTATFNQSGSVYYDKIYQNNEKKEAGDMNGKKESAAEEEKLEGKKGDEPNELSNHQCMETLVQLFKTLMNITKNDVGKPQWIGLIENPLRSNCSPNIKIFLIGAIMKVGKAFQPYAGDLFDPILRPLVKGEFGSTLNYFVKDILLMLLSWTENITQRPSPSRTKEVLKFFIEKFELIGSRKDVYYNDLSILQAILRFWIPENEHESRIPFESIGKRLKNLGDQTIGIDLCRNFLRIGILPFERIDGDKDVGDLITLLTHSLKNNSKPTCLIVGETLGYLLTFLEKQEHPLTEKILVGIKRKLIEFKNRTEFYIVIISALQRCYPAFFRNDPKPVYELIWDRNHNAMGLLPSIFEEELRPLRDTPERLNEKCVELFRSLEARRVFEGALSSDEELRYGLKLFGFFLKNFRDGGESRFVKLINWVENSELSSDEKILTRYAQLLTELYKVFKQDTREVNTIPKRIESMFIRLYKNENEELQKIVNEFWSENLKHWGKSPALILELMELLGDEQDSLKISLDLIMKRCSKSPDFNKKIFDQALEESREFLPQPLDTSWRFRNASFNPLFAESLSSNKEKFSMLPPRLQSSIMRQTQGTAFGGNLLKSTLQALKFSQTQDGKQNFDSQSQPEYNLFDNRFPSAESLDAMQTDQVEEGFEKETPGAEEPVSSLSSLRRRFYERPANASAFYAGQEVRRQNSEIEKSVELAKRRRIGVALVRNYRIGDIPDIQIKHSDFLLTLTSLAKIDEEVGKTFLVHLFKNMVQEMPPEERALFITNAGLTFEKIIKSSSPNLNPHFAGALIEIATENRIPIDLFSVSNLAKSFDLQKLAILKFEGELSNVELKEPTNKRARSVGIQADREGELWIRIAELYKELDEFDSVRDIFSHIAEKTESFEEKGGKARNALKFENDGDYEDAFKIYKELCAGTSEESNASELDQLLYQFWDDANYKCLKHLSNWKECYDRADSFNAEGGAVNENAHKSRYVEKILPYQIKAGSQILIRNPEDDEFVTKYSEFLEDLKKKDEWKDLLANYPLELSLTYGFLEAWAQSIIYLNSAFESNLKSFLHFDNLSNAQKKEQLLDIQYGTYLKEGIDWILKEVKDLGTLENNTRKLLLKWDKSSVGKISLYNCDSLVSLRNWLINVFGPMLYKIDDEMLNPKKDEIFNEMAELKKKQFFWAIDLAIKNKNRHVAEAYINLAKATELDNEGDEEMDGDVGYSFEINKAECRFLSIFKESKDWINLWTKSWTNLGQMEDKNTGYIESEMLVNLLDRITLDGIAPRAIKKVATALEIPDSQANLLDNIIEKGFKIVRNGLQERMDEDGNEDEDEFSDSSASMNFYHLLRYVKINFSEKYEGNEEIHELMMTSLLKGMENGLREASQLFPTCFAILEQFPRLHSTFKNYCSIIESWVFLPWLDQLMTYYKTCPELKPALEEIISKLLKDYPQAFQLQYADFLEERGVLTYSKPYERALNALVLPHFLFSKYSSLPVNRDSLLVRLNEFRGLMDEINGSEYYGKTHKDFVKEIHVDVIAAIEKLQDSDAFDSQECFEIGGKVAKTLERAIQDAKRKFSKVKTIALESLSPWLERYHFANSTVEQIELPGLYNDFGICAPNLALHPRIVSFDPTLLILDSKASPLRLSVIGNNGKSYRFLAKYGDDLRLDKRVQQLFRFVNEIFKGIPNCQYRSLSISSYSVIPINVNFGMIEWVDKTVPLKEFIFKSGESLTAYKSSKEKYSGWISSCNDKKNPINVAYGNVAKQPKGKVVEKFQGIVNSLNPEIFRDKVKAASYGLEEYFTLREKMIRSYSTMCLIHWLLGIGDRHLSNCMISLVDGHFIGIDFGYAFGTTISTLPVPELVPFRLTPQLENFLLPYGHNGLFKETMLFAWKAILNSSELISNFIEAFIREPTLDWQKKPNNSQFTQSLGGKKITNHPIEIVRLKLKRGNPVRILLVELGTASPHLSSQIKFWEEVVKMDRKDLERKHLEEEEVIDTLLSLASDYNLLGRMWEGWSSWV